MPPTAVAAFAGGCGPAHLALYCAKWETCGQNERRLLLWAERAQEIGAAHSGRMHGRTLLTTRTMLGKSPRIFIGRAVQVPMMEATKTRVFSDPIVGDEVMKSELNARTRLLSDSCYDS